jgi:hypothetical protein
MRGWHMKNADLPKRHLFSNKVNIDFDVLGATMLNRVRSHVDSTDIVTEHHSRGGKRIMKLAKKLPDPTTFSNSMSYSAVFRLGTGAGNCRLPLRRPRDQVITKINTVA